MKKILIRLAINAVAFYVAIALLQDTYIEPQTNNWLSFLWLAVIFGVINAVLRPLLMIVSCPLILLTLGLGTLLINMLLFVLAGWIGSQFGVGFEVNGIVGAFLGSLVVSVVSIVLSMFFHDELK